MINRFDFYKEFYFKELDKRNEINNSLSLPIGLISALVASNFYLITNFDFKYQAWLSISFSTLLVIGLLLLIFSIFHLIKAYNDFPKGYEYILIPDTTEIDKYYNELKEYYKNNSSLLDTSDIEVEDYLLNEMIKNTGENQKNNKRKYKFRYNCEYYLIACFITLCLSATLFSINYAKKPEKNDITKVKLIDVNPNEIITFTIDTTKFKMAKATTNTSQPPKPTPPLSQVIKEGQNPKPKR